MSDMPRFRSQTPMSVSKRIRAPICENIATNRSPADTRRIRRLPGMTPPPPPVEAIAMSPVHDAEIGPFPIGAHITLRRMLLRNPNPKGTVLLLHGFPETLLAWRDIAHALADDFEVHAFDWPASGLPSRPAD